MELVVAVLATKLSPLNDLTASGDKSKMMALSKDATVPIDKSKLSLDPPKIPVEALQKQCLKCNLQAHHLENSAPNDSLQSHPLPRNDSSNDSLKPVIDTPSSLKNLAKMFLNDPSNDPLKYDVLVPTSV